MRVALAIPAYGDVRHATARSLWRLTSFLTARNVVVDEPEHVGDPDLGRARNALLAAFLRGRASRILFVDTDVSFEPSDAWKLVASTADYVGANYPRKSIGGGWTSLAKRGGAENGALVEAEMIATGLLSLSRAAVERLAAHSIPYLGNDGLATPAIAVPGVVGGRWESEDEAMCRKWQSLGERAWIDTSIRCEHVGQFVFTKETA